MTFILNLRWPGHDSDKGQGCGALGDTKAHAHAHVHEEENTAEGAMDSVYMSNLSAN